MATYQALRRLSYLPEGETKRKAVQPGDVFDDMPEAAAKDLESYGYVERVIRREPTTYPPAEESPLD